MAQVDELTDWQIEEFYLKPARGRARERARRGRGGVPRQKTRLPTREEYANIGAQLGGNRETLGAAYDRWAASPEGVRSLNKKPKGP